MMISYYWKPRTMVFLTPCRITVSWSPLQSGIGEVVVKNGWSWILHGRIAKHHQLSELFIGEYYSYVLKNYQWWYMMDNPSQSQLGFSSLSSRPSPAPSDIHLGTLQWRLQACTHPAQVRLAQRLVNRVSGHPTVTASCTISSPVPSSSCCQHPHEEDNFLRPCGPPERRLCREKPWQCPPNWEDEHPNSWTALFIFGM